MALVTGAAKHSGQVITCFKKIFFIVDLFSMVKRTTYQIVAGTGPYDTFGLYGYVPNFPAHQLPGHPILDGVLCVGSGCH